MMIMQGTLMTQATLLAKLCCLLKNCIPILLRAQPEMFDKDNIVLEHIIITTMTTN